MADALLWLLTIELLGVLAVPWAFHLFRFLPDRGITLVKPAALLVLTYLVWVLGLVKLLPNTQLTIWAIVLCIAVASLWYAGRRWDDLREFLEHRWPVLLAGELVFLLMFVAWAMVVSGSPGITHTEKPMDFMLLNSAHQARYFPAEDAWLSGHSISYYYFGHIIMATVSKMSGVMTSVGYNLAVATLPALAGSVCFGLLYNLVRLTGGGTRWALGVGAAAPAVLLLLGNLAGGLEFVRAQGWGGEGFWDWVAVDGLQGGTGDGGFFPANFWWWFGDTRIIGTASPDGTLLDYTITEFPAFSFLLGDLHAHVLAIPFLLLALASALNIYSSDDRLDASWLRRNPSQAVWISLSGGSLAFINFWDFPTFMAIFAAALLLKGCREHPDSLLRAANAAASVFLPLFLLSIALFGPVYFAFSGQTSGALPLREVSTRPFHLSLVLGLFILPSLALLARFLPVIRRHHFVDSPLAVVAMLIAMLPLALWVATAFLFALTIDGAGPAFDDLGRRLVLAGPGAIIVGTSAYTAAKIARSRLDPASSFVVLLVCVGFFLVMIAELFHIVDSFSGPWRRMNTVFKVYYQAWLLLGIAATFAVYPLWSVRASAVTGRRPAMMAGRWAGGLALGVLVLAAFYYTLGAALDRGGAYGAPPEGRTVDGLAYLKTSEPGEYAAIAWLRDEATPGRIVEAVGDDYSRHGNVSASTGLPTVLGWTGHELQWRGSPEPFAGRERDVAAIYSGQDPEEARRLLESYGVRYVYLGNREMAKYGVSTLHRYSEFLRTVFQSEGVVVYEFWNDTDL